MKVTLSYIEQETSFWAVNSVNRDEISLMFKNPGTMLLAYDEGNIMLIDQSYDPTSHLLKHNDISFVLYNPDTGIQELRIPDAG